MHFEFHAGQRDLYLVDAIEHRSYTLQVDRGGQLLDKVLLHGSTRLRETIDVIPQILAIEVASLWSVFPTRSLSPILFHLFSSCTQAFYAAASGILRRLQRHFVFRKPGSVWPSTAHFFVFVTEKYACGLASSCGISDV